MDLLLEMKNVQISFPYADKSLKVVRGLDLAVPKGEIIGILGESGSGKTVSSAAILGLIEDEEGVIDEGSIIYDGADIRRCSEKELRRLRGREISCVFQNPSETLNPYLTVGRQVSEVLKIHGQKSSKETVLQAFSEVGLENAATVYNMYPFQLSGGQCQRVAIAMAVICRPRLLIADEPTSSIDASLRDKITSLLMEINKKYSTAIILITHDLAVADLICHRIIVMYGGLVMEEGLRDDVLGKPLHPYTRQLLKCVDSFRTKGDRLYTLEGSSASPLEYGEECPFYARCPQKTAQCRQGIPPLREKAPGWKVRCFGNE